MEKKVIEVEIKSNSESLKKQLKEAQREVEQLSEKFGATSEQAVKAAKKAAELKDAIGEAKSLTDAFNPDAKFNALSDSIGGVLNGFQAFEGAMGLIGVESENVQEALLKVQSAMALSQGLQGVLEAKDSFAQLGAVVKNAFAGMTSSAKLFMVTGIGLLLAGIGLLVAKWDDVSRALGRATEAQRANMQVKKLATEEIKKELNASDSLSKKLKDENLSRAEKVKLIKEFQKDYPGLLDNINTERDSIEKINKQLIDNVKLLKLQAEAKALSTIREETYQKKAQLQLKLQSEALENATNWTVEYGESAENGFLGFSTAAENAKRAQMDVNKIQNEGTKVMDKQIKSLDQAEKNIQKEIEALQKLGASTKDLSAEKDKEAEKEKERQAKIKEQRDKLAEQRKQDLQKLKEYYIEARKVSDASLRDERQNEIAAVDEKYKERFELAKKYGKDTTDLTIAYRNEVNAINVKYDQEEKLAQEAKDKEELEARMKKYEDRLALEKEQSAALLEARAREIELDPNALNEEKQAIELEQLKESYKAKFELATENSILEKQLEETYQAEKDAIKDKYSKLELERVEAERQAKLKAASDDLETSENALKSIQNLSDTFFMLKLNKLEKGSKEEEKVARKQFQFNKALMLGLAIIDGAKAVTSSLAQSPLAIGPVPNPIGIASLATAVTTSALQIAKIASMQFQSGGAELPPPSGVGGGGGATPNFNVVGNSTANQLAQIEQKPVQAYVVSNEVTTQQALDRNRQVNATFG